MGAASILALALLLALQEPTALDGRRGFGAAATLQEVQRVLKARKGEDLEFCTALDALEGEIQVALGGLRLHYRKQGWFQLLGPRADEDVEALHASYRRACEAPDLVFAVGGERATALAGLLADTRFNVRLDLIEAFEGEASDLRRALAVLRATVEGYVLLEESDLRAVLSRADLAAAHLRALRSDLQVLQPSRDGGRESSDLERELFEVARLPEDDRPAALRRSLERAELQERRMADVLAFPRLLPASATLRAERERARTEGAVRRLEVLEWLPPAERWEGDREEDLHAESRKHERMQQVLFRAQQGLLADPLDEDLAYAAGFSMDFIWGGIHARSYYDRFLALRGIRSHDHRTLKERELDAREKRALAAVQSQFSAPGGR